MAAQTPKEKALNFIAKQIKEMDKNTLNLEVLKSNMELNSARANLFNIISKNGYELTRDYKVSPMK